MGRTATNIRISASAEPETDRRKPNGTAKRRRREMKALLVAVLPVLSALALALPGAVPAAGRDHSAAVTRWISVDLAEIAAHRTNPPRAARGLALLSVAIDDASRVPRKHRRAAIAGAATTVLTYLYPDRTFWRR
jgi:hypothetical protein